MLGLIGLAALGVWLAPGLQAAAANVVKAVKEKLAGYKAPKSVVAIDTIGRAPNGKVDYKRLRQYAMATLGIQA